MFESAMLDSTARARAQRRWTTVLSVVVQLALVGALLLLPVISPDSILPLRFADRIMLPVAKASGPEFVAGPVKGEAGGPKSPNQITLQQPAEIPKTIDSGPGEIPEPPGLGTSGHRCLFGCSSGSPHGVIGGDPNGFVPTVREPEPAPKRIVVSSLDPGFLLHRVQPVYPPIAKQAGVQGPVVLRAIIGKDGEIQELRVVSGHPWLSRAAREAVEQWRYRPYMLNGVAVEVETQVTVNFYLSGR